MKELSNLLKVLLILVIFLGGSFYLGYRQGKNKRLVEVKTEVKYLPSNPIFGSIDKFEPIEVNIPPLPKWIVKRDTLIRDSILTVFERVDTAEILADWCLKRSYNLTAFENDSLGKLEVSWITQYNQSSEFNYVYTPYTREVKTERQYYKKFRLSAGFGTHDNWLGQFQYSLTNRVNLGYQYQNKLSMDNSTHFVVVGIDF